MPHLQRFTRPLLAAVVLVASLAFAAAPTSAQNEGVKVFVIANDMVNDEDKEEQWQMQVTIIPTGGCTPTEGRAGYSSTWLDAGSEVGIELSLGECIFRIGVAIREASFRTDCFYMAQLSWEPAGGTTPAGSHVFTSDRPDGVTRLSVIRNPSSVCAFPPETRYYIDGSNLVDDLPGPSADAELLALAQRAAEIAAFEIRLEPDRAAGTVPPGCDRTANITVHGGGQRVRHSLQVSGGPCRFQASIARAQAAFEAFEGGAVTFTDNARIVNLSSLVRLPQARIAIIQDTRGSGDEGSASYSISRSCGDVSVTSPAATGASAVLREGRFTVHSPSAPGFGATAMYPAAAASTDSDDIVGCSVTAAVDSLPAGCVVDGGPMQTRTWTEAAPIRHFDFEFDINCGSAVTAPPTTTTTSPQTTTTTTAPTTTGTVPAEDMVPVEDDSPVDPGPEPQPTVPEGPLADMPTG